MPGKLIPGEEKTPVYKKQTYGEGLSPFSMRSGNSTPFKQMGSSPLKAEDDVVKGGVKPEVVVSATKNPSAKEVFEGVKKASMTTKTGTRPVEALTKAYGDQGWHKGEGGMWRTSAGMSAKKFAVLHSRNIEAQKSDVRKQSKTPLKQRGPRDVQHGTRDQQITPEPDPSVKSAP